MLEFDLEEMFKVKILENKYLNVKDLKQFFAERYIDNSKIACALGVSSQLIGYWFNGRRPTPAKRREELEYLKSRFVEWEEEHGEMFNVGKVLSCPYTKDGLEFGINYDVYIVCDSCGVRLECENENQRQTSASR